MSASFENSKASKYVGDTTFGELQRSKSSLAVTETASRVGRLPRCHHGPQKSQPPRQGSRCQLCSSQGQQACDRSYSQVRCCGSCNHSGHNPNFGSWQTKEDLWNQNSYNKLVQPAFKEAIDFCFTCI